MAISEHAGDGGSLRNKKGKPLLDPAEVTSETRELHLRYLTAFYTYDFTCPLDRRAGSPSGDFGHCSTADWGGRVWQGCGPQSDQAPGINQVLTCPRPKVGGNHLCAPRGAQGGPPSKVGAGRGRFGAMRHILIARLRGRTVDANVDCIRCNRFV